MKIQKSLISLAIVFGLLFCLAFACNDENTRQTRSEKSEKANNRTTTGDESEDEADETDNDSGAESSGLPAGTYSCSTTVPIYAGQGGSGSQTYPIYNYSRQTRGEINVKSDGTYTVGGSRCHYSYDAATKTIQWQDCAFAAASSSRLTADDKGNQVIQVKFSNDKDVWDCAK